MPGDSRLVYSTDGGRVKPPAGEKPPTNRPRKSSPQPPQVPQDGIVRIMRDRRGRGGKTATSITGLPGSEADLDALLKLLKQHCGAGGVREGRVLAIQGDQRDHLHEKLTALGHRVKLAGG
jgi:translation initiation factor 1